jgi:hypothetical protein
MRIILEDLQQEPVDQMAVTVLSVKLTRDLAYLFQVLQTITSSNKLLSGVASYPGEGGYV